MTVTLATAPSANRQALQRTLVALRREIIGYESQTELLLLAAVVGGHVSALGEPGTAKSLTMDYLGQLIAGSVCRRIQCVPDLLPADMLGSEVPDELTREFKFLPGPINPNTNLLHVDEINRTPERNQAALLQAMQEGKVSVPGFTQHTFTLNKMFMVVATRNPSDSGGTYPLPIAQMDRFAIELIYNRLSKENERKVIERTYTDNESLTQAERGVITVEQILEARQEIKKIHVSSAALAYAHELCFATRPEACPPKNQGLLSKGVSTRACQWALRLAKARAFLRGGNHVTAADIQFVIRDVLRHRLQFSAQAQMNGVNGDAIIDEVLKFVPIENEASLK